MYLKTLCQCVKMKIGDIMITESILDALELLYSKRENFSSEELDKVEFLTIKKIDYDGEILSVDFNDLLNFKNLKNLAIDGCMLDLNLMLVLQKLPFLENLSLYNCEVIEDIYPLFENINIKNLLLDNTNFDLTKLSHNYENLKVSSVEFRPFNSFVKSLDVSSCKIDNLDLLLNCNFDEIIISYELYSNNQLLFDELDKSVTIMEENGQFAMKRDDNYGNI